MSIDDDSLSQKAKQLLEDACFYSFVDSHFNFLRKPDKYNNEIAKIVKLYYAAFNSILKALLTKSNLVNKLDEIIKSDKHNFHNNRIKIDKLLQESQKIIIDEYKDNKEIYYNIIRDFNDKSDYDVSVITTNYTNFAQNMVELSNDSISYIHGKLDLFEDVKTKRVGKITEFNEENTVFPFIFVQSGIKPIVNGKQIIELSRASDMIYNSDEVIILGYNVNSDDEHIANMLRERLYEGKKITCYIYCEATKNSEYSEEYKSKTDKFQNELAFHKENLHFEDIKNFSSNLKKFTNYNDHRDVGVHL